MRQPNIGAVRPNARNCVGALSFLFGHKSNPFAPANGCRIESKENNLNGLKERIDVGCENVKRSI